LIKHDLEVSDPVCKRITKAGKPCPATPSFPSGLCIKHKAKLDWDRQRQKRILEQELERRRVNGTESNHGPADKFATELHDPKDISDLVESNDMDDTSTQVSMRMWGEVDLFARSTTQPSYFQAHHMNHPPTYQSNFALATPGLHLHVARLRLFRPCLILAYLASLTISSSLVLALWWSIAHKDPSGGFTMAGYIVAVGGIVMFPIQSHHSKSCKCWKRDSQTPGT
jgi:hypothetical protein